jgi:DNA polymerase (family 10)
MDLTNRQVADRLTFMGQLLEITGQNVFKIRAFYRAADVVGRLAAPVSAMDLRELETLSGIGRNIAAKIREIVETGTFAELEGIRKEVPEPLIEMLQLEGVGPKTVSTLWKKMNIQSIEDLEKAARGRRIRSLKGFGEKKEDGFLKAITLYRRQSGRMNRLEADTVVGKVTSVLLPGTYEVAGSYRRGKSTIGDIDIVSTEPASALNRKLRTIADEIIDEGDRKTSFRCMEKRVDVRFTHPGGFGSMLMYLTGSKEFNIRMREIAINKGAKLNEYGVINRNSGKLQEFENEEEIFSFLGMDPVVPELREDRGEIQAAIAHTLPVLIEQGQIRGDLHVHSGWSDGNLSLSELAVKGEAIGYEYLLVSDHSATLGIAHGLDEDRIKAQGREIERVNRESSCMLLHGIEVDIKSDGTLGLPDHVLSDLDLVIASVHSAFGQPRDVMTRRVLTAMENEHVDIIGHPTGRILGRREAYEIDMQRIIDLAAETGTALECNASPYRLDLDDNNIKEAHDKGVLISIGTDTHDPSEFMHMKYGVITCRRGWASAADILNTRNPAEILEWTA